MGIWLSVLLRPTLTPDKAAYFTITAAVAIADALSTLGWPITIKWPNDLLLEGKKVCGILAELESDIDQVHWLILGMGINYHEAALPQELQDIAISLNKHMNHSYSRAQITAEILRAIEKYYHLLCKEGFTSIRKQWLSFTNCIGQQIKANTLSGTFYGKALDIDENGYLILELADGSIKKILTGDIHLNT
jgi:BirA family biotin operon repressor/biotin-[acetyl-CoA-carboxylase] ligase